MARVRMVNPEFFLHEGLGRCSAHARLLLVALWTQADREGRLRWLPLRIHGEAFPHEPDLFVDALAQELIEVGVLDVYRVGGRTYASLPGFPRWQRPHKNETESRCPLPPPPVEGQPLADLESAFGALDTDNGIRITEMRNTDRTPSSDGVSPGRRRDAVDPAATVLEIPTGDEALDYLLETWSGLLGKHDTLERWLATSRAAYPGVDVLAEARRAAAWEQSNPAKKKKQVRAFLSRWWGRAQDRGGSSSSTGSSVEADALAFARDLGAQV